MLTIESAPYIFSVFLSVIKYPALVKINTITQIINGTYFIWFTLFYKKIYLHTNNTASIYIKGLTFFAFPQNTLITTYDITPSAIPSEMLYISGIARSARYAGTDSVRSVKSTLMIDEIIRKPTKIT